MKIKLTQAKPRREHKVTINQKIIVSKKKNADFTRFNKIQPLV